MLKKNSKERYHYECSSCGARFLKWQGQCSKCGEWGTLEEIRTTNSSMSGGTIPHTDPNLLSLQEISKEHIKVFSSGSESFDGFLGQGMAAGSVILLGGEPGVGKSTFLMQLMAGFLSSGQRGVYVSGEESPVQLKIRAERLGIQDPEFRVLNTHDLYDIFGVIRSKKPPQFMIIDSIQTIKSPDVPGIIGGVSQIKEVASRLYEEVKHRDIVLILVSHITKDGQIAGPKVLEHVVDVVLYMEGDRLSSYRILKITKNRFGPCNNILVLEMGNRGLKIVKDPSTFFLTTRDTNAPGSALIMAMEGQRPLVIEVQALVSRSFGQNPRRTSVGIDLNRLYLLLAILEKRLGLKFSEMDVYVKIGAGIKITDPAIDLGVCSAILSSYFDVPVPEKAVFWGEVDLSGFVRPSFGEEKRLSQAINLNFSPIICPSSKHIKVISPNKGISVIKNICELRNHAF